MSGINRQPECLEVPVKGKTGDIIEHMSYYNKRNGITKGYFFISGEFLENLLSRCSNRIIKMDNIENRFNFIKKLQSCFVACPVSEKGYGFAYDIPCRIDRKFMLFAIFEKFYSFFIVGIVRV